MLDSMEIKRWLDLYEIKNYTIQEDKSVDVEGDVILNLFNKHNKLSRIPVKFGVVSGNFDCSFNALTSLENVPHTVGKGFCCSYNILTSLLFAPQRVNTHFFCDNNTLTSLEHSPLHIEGKFQCSHNQIKDLKGAPKSVGDSFICHHNELTCYKDLPLKIGKNLECADNPLTYEAYLIQEKIKKEIEDEKTALKNNLVCEQKVKAVSKFKI